MGSTAQFTHIVMVMNIFIGVGTGWLVCSLTQPAPRWFGWIAFITFIGLAIAFREWGHLLFVEAYTV